MPISVLIVYYPFSAAQAAVFILDPPREPPAF